MSIRKGTFFEKSKLKLHAILMIIGYYSEGVTSQRFLMKQIGIITPQTIVDWKSFVRDVFINYVLNHSNMIGGPNIIVQVDECLLCKRKYRVGRILINQDLWIVGGIDSNGGVFMELTTVRSREVLRDIIVRNVIPGSILVTDGWGGYNGLENEYLRQVVIHQHQFVNAEGYHKNQIEATWGACKRLFRKNTNKRREMMFSYLCEYIFRKTFPDNTMAQTFLFISVMYPLD